MNHNNPNDPYNGHGSATDQCLTDVQFDALAIEHGYTDGKEAVEGRKAVPPSPRQVSKWQMFALKCAWVVIATAAAYFLFCMWVLWNGGEG